MASKSALRKVPAAPPAPLGLDGDPCHIVFGHNVEIQKVLMRFSVAATQLVFSPDEAEDVAQKLTYYAKAARGQKPS